MRRRKILIHLGAHRTGTTYLQAAFAQNRQALADRNIRYLSFHYFPEYRRAFLRARHALRDCKPETFEKHFAPIAKLLSEQLKLHPDHDFLISYEGFLGDLSLERSIGLYPVHDVLLPRLLNVFVGEDVHGAFSIREYGSFVESGYKYLAQIGLKKSFRRYSARLDRNGMSWLPIMRSLRAACGDELSVWAYDDFAKSPAALVDWLFRRAFGRDGDFLEWPPRPRNASVSRAALPALLFYNRIFRSSRKSSNKIYGLLLRYLPLRTFGSPRLYDPSTRDELRQRYDDDIAAIRNEFPDFYSVPSSG